MKTWYIQAYKYKQKLQDRDFRMIDALEVITEADNEKEALMKAKEIIKRKYYRVFKVWDKPDDIHEELQATQLELQAKLLKALRARE